MAKKKKREEHDEHVNHERWLVSYADMMTLLMVLFIVMFAISQVDQKRFMQLRDGMAAGFGQQPSPFQGDRSVLEEAGSAPMAPIQPAINGDAMPEVGGKPIDSDQMDDATADAVAKALAEDQRSEEQDEYAEARAEVARLDKLRKAIEKALAAEGLRGDVRIRIDERGLRVSLVSRHIVFANNLADLTERGRRTLTSMAPVLRRLPNQIEVAGHTNQIDVKPKYYDTDWDLSAARAVTVLRYLDERLGVPPEQMVAAAYGHEQPLVPPSKPGSQAINKRVDLVVLSTAAESVRKLFGQVQRDART